MKGWMWGIAGTVIGSILVLLITSFLASHEEGSEALGREQIRQEIKSALDDKLNVKIGGQTKTMGEAMSLMNDRQVRMEEALKRLTE